VLILKGVKVICIDALSQVLILKGLGCPPVDSRFRGAGGAEIKDRGGLVPGVSEEEGAASIMSGSETI
jgi:hypothetical protein